MQLRKALGGAERLSDHLRTKARSTHAQQHGVPNARIGDLPGGLLQWTDVRQLVVGDVQPAQPALLIGTGPERGVFCPQTADLAGPLPIRDDFRNAGRKMLRQCVGLPVEQRRDLAASPLVYRREQAIERLAEERDAVFEQPVGHVVEGDPDALERGDTSHARPRCCLQDSPAVGRDRGRPRASLA